MNGSPTDVLAEAACKLEALSDEALAIVVAQGNAGAEALDLPPAVRWFGAALARAGESARTGLADWDALLELGEAAHAADGLRNDERNR